jgi:hypothetical protein
MTKEEKLKKIELLKKKANELKKEVDYYNALQLALKLVLNGSYGAFATSYFILYNNHVAGTITAQGRDLTRTMDKVNEDYWYRQWQNDHELHYRLGIKNVTAINKDDTCLSISTLHWHLRIFWRNIFSIRFFNKICCNSVNRTFSSCNFLYSFKKWFSLGQGWI